jgi:hypothetical protein
MIRAQESIVRHFAFELTFGPLLSVSAALLSGAADAQEARPLAGPPCQTLVKRPIAFSSPTAEDRLTVSIGPGACHSARLSIVVTSVRGEVLYRYVAPFKRHVVTPWDDPELPNVARQFVADTAMHAAIRKDEIPAPKPEGQADPSDATLAVPASVFERLASSGQPMLYHQTYYEGGQYVVFDPRSRIARVVVRQGL